MAYCCQSSLILYFFKAAGKTFQHGSSNVTLKLLYGLSPSRDEFAMAVLDGVSFVPTEDELTFAAGADGVLVGAGLL